MLLAEDRGSLINCFVPEEHQWPKQLQNQQLGYAWGNRTIHIQTIPWCFCLPLIHDETK
jgi:hypothetical protein